MTDDLVVRAEREGSLLLITLARPELLNRIDAAAHEALIAILERVRDDPAIRCIVLASTGKAFSAGGDLQEVFVLHDDAQRRKLMFDQGRRLFAALLDIAIPIVVAVQGDAHGMGATLVLACDAVVAARSARISDPHVRLGMVPGDGGCVVWPQAMGMVAAKRYLLTGDALTAEQAFARGLVTDLVDTPDEVLPAARTLALRIAALPPLAVQGAKRALNAVLKQRAGEVFELALSLEAATMVSDDVIEAASAFLEKRPATFTGQ